MTTLRVMVDGEPLPAEEAVAFWKRFSTWMDEHPGDLAGFAKGEGLSSVQPEMQGGAPVLVASRTASQKPYTTARSTPGAAGGKGKSAAPGRGGRAGESGSPSGSRAVHAPGPKGGGAGGRNGGAGKNRSR